MILPVSISPWSTPVKVVSVHLYPGYYAVHETNIQPWNQHTYRIVNVGSPNMLFHSSLGFYHNYNFPHLLMILIWSLFWFRQLRDLPSPDGYFIFTQHCSYRRPGVKAPGHQYPQCWQTSTTKCPLHFTNSPHMQHEIFIRGVSCFIGLLCELPL